MSLSLWESALATLTEEQKQGIDLQVSDRRAILDDLAAAVREKKQQCIAGRLRFKRRNGDVVVLHDIFLKIARWLDKFKQIGDVAVQYDPGHASLPWAAVRFLIQCSINGIQMQEEMFEGLEIVCRIIAHYAVIERLYSPQMSSGSPLLQEAITSTYASILIFLSTSLQQYQHGVARRLLRGVLPSSWVTDHIHDVEENYRKMTEITTLITSERVQSIRDDQIAAQSTMEHLDARVQELQVGLEDQTSSLKELLQSFQEPLVRTIEDTAAIQLRQEIKITTDNNRAERKKILCWLSTVTYKSHHQAISEKILNGTGSWLIEHPRFRDWTDTSTISLLWLHGIPGAGKTFLMATVINHLTELSKKRGETVPLAYFYCSRNAAEAQRADPTEVVLALLKQIVCSRKDWQENSQVAKHYRKLQDISEEDGTEIVRLNIKEAAGLLKVESKRTPMVLFVDAFDECLPRERYKLMNIFKALMEDANMIVKILISSRDDTDIGSSFCDFPDIQIQTSNAQDIYHFVRTEIQSAINERRILNGRLSKRLQVQMVKVLSEKSQGMFLWASLQISGLCDRRRLKTEHDLENELLRLPQSLTDMYSSIVEDIYSLRETGKAIAEAMFQWLLYGLDFSLYPTLSYCAIASNMRQKVSLEEALDICANLVIYDTITARFRFAHLSVQEYLQTRIEYHSKRVNKLILQNLAHACTSNSHSLSSIVPSKSTEIHSEKPLRTKLSYFQGYWSHKYLQRTWPHHYVRICETDRQTIFGSVKQFIFQERLLWKPFIENSVLVQHINKRFQNASNDKLITNAAKARTQALTDAILKLILHEALWNNINFECVKTACTQGWQEVLDEIETILPPVFSSLGALSVARSLLSQGSVSRFALFNFNRYKPEAENEAVSIMQQFIGGAPVSFKLHLIPLARLIDCENCIMDINGELNSQALSQCTQNSSLANVWEISIKKLIANKAYDNIGKASLLLLAVTYQAPMSVIRLMLSEGADPHLGSPVLNWWTPFLASLRLNQQCLSKELLAWTSDNSDTALVNGKCLLQSAIDKKFYYTACAVLLYGLSTVFASEEIRTEWLSLLSEISLDQRPAVAGMELERREVCAGPMIPHFGFNLPNDAISEVLLCTAAQLRHDGAINSLLQMGVNPACPSITPRGPKVQNNDKEAEIHHQIQAEKSEKGLNQAQLELKQAPLAWATATGNSYLIRKVLDQGVSPNLAGPRNQTAIFSAVQREEFLYLGENIESNKLEVVQLLISRGADPACVDTDGRTASWYALQSGFPRIAKWLIEACPKPSDPALHAVDSRLWNVFNGGEERIAQSLLAKTKGSTTSTSESSSSRDSNIALVARFINNGVGRMLAQQSQEVHDGDASRG